MLQCRESRPYHEEPDDVIPVLSSSSTQVVFFCHLHILRLFVELYVISARSCHHHCTAVFILLKLMPYLSRRRKKLILNMTVCDKMGMAQHIVWVCLHVISSAVWWTENWACLVQSISRIECFCNNIWSCHRVVSKHQQNVHCIPRADCSGEGLAVHAYVALDLHIIRS